MWDQRKTGQRPTNGGYQMTKLSNMDFQPRQFFRPSQCARAIRRVPLLLIFTIFMGSTLHLNAKDLSREETATDGQSVEIQIPWARVTKGKNGACYVTISSQMGDQLMGASAGDDDLCDHVELHTHTEEDGVMKMRPVSRIDVAAEEPLIMAPGGLHIMLMGLKHPLTEGQRLPLKLQFKNAGWVEVDVPVCKRIPVSSKMAPAVSEASSSCCGCCPETTIETGIEAIAETSGSEAPSPGIKTDHGS